MNDGVAGCRPRPARRGRCGGRGVLRRPRGCWGWRRAVDGAECALVCCGSAGLFSLACYESTGRAPIPSRPSLRSPANSSSNTLQLTSANQHERMATGTRRGIRRSSVTGGGWYCRVWVGLLQVACIMRRRATPPPRRRTCRPPRAPPRTRPRRRTPLRTAAPPPARSSRPQDLC